MPRSSRLASQRPVRKPTRLGRQQPKNSYRRRSSPRSGKRICLRVFLGGLGFFSLAGLCLGMVWVYYQLLTCSLFCIKDMSQIEVTGVRRLSPAFILKEARLEPGTNLLALRPGQSEQALLSHPWIARAELIRKWPNRVELRIQEREPVALVQLGELFYLDRQGRLFKPLSPGDPHDFPVITGLAREDFAPEPGMALPIGLSRIFQLLDLLKQAPPPLNLENISEVRVDRDRGFTLYANGLQSAVDLGLSDFPAKLEKFTKVWPILVQQGYQTRVTRINLDYSQRVLLSLHEPAIGNRQ